MPNEEEKKDPVVRCIVEALKSWGCDDRGIVVAVSGGPDSVALLRAVLACDDSQRPKLLVVAHLNHQLRGDESDADESFVRDLVARLQKSCDTTLEFSSTRMDVARLAAAKNANLETMARTMRYDWLAGIAHEHGLCCIATGHTADDQAETLLHRLLRGSGIKGLRGIAPRRKLAPGIDLIRPLLAVRREQVMEFLHSVKQGFREDKSNLDPRFTRNRIRHQLLPVLTEQYNPRIGEVLRRLAEQTDELFEWIEAMARRLLDQAERPRAGKTIVLDGTQLAAAPPYLVREVFRLLWQREGWPQDGMGFDEWTRLAALARGELTAFDLSGGIRARSGERVVQVGPVS